MLLHPPYFMKFKESALAHKYLDGLSGIEIGGSAHNPFNIKNCKNVDYTDDMTTVFKKEEQRLCGEMLPVDIVAYGDKLPLEDKSVDFVLSSHVLEHLYDPIKALNEWKRVARRYIFMIVPHASQTFDRTRPRTKLCDLFNRKEDPGTNEHFNVWHTEDVLELCSAIGLNVVEWQDRDDKVGNGFTVVIDLWN